MGAVAEPGFIEPMLATLVAAPFDGPDWLFEVKWDGFRVEAVVDGGDGPDLDPRPAGRGAATSATSWRRPTGSPPATRSSMARSSPSTTRGEPDFALLQDRIKGRGDLPADDGPFVYEVFDLLHLDGRSLLDEPLEERRRLLAGVLRAGSSRPAQRAHRGGRASRSSRRPGRAASRASWRRTAARPTCPGSGRWRGRRSRSARSRSSSSAAGRKGTGKAVGLGALLVGVYEDGALRYAGKVGAGFTGTSRGRAAGGARSRSRPTPSPFDPPPPRAGRPDGACGSARSSSSAPSSPAGRATAWSARRPTRAWTSARTRGRSARAPEGRREGLTQR